MSVAKATKAAIATTAAAPGFGYDDVSRLRTIDIRLRSLRIHEGGNPEIARMEAAHADVLARLTPEQVKEYKGASKPKSKAQLAAEAEADRIAMESNKDRPSI